MNTNTGVSWKLSVNEIKDAMAILKARWPEVFLIVGIQVLSMFGNTLFSHVAEINSILGLTIIVCMLALVVIIVLLPVGFLRTVHLEGPKRQYPLDLLRVGKHFFWRVIRVGLLWIPAYLLLAWMIFMVVKQPEVTDTGFWETGETDPLVFYCCLAVARLILIKPVLLILPIVIVTDCRISTSFGLLKRCRLSDAEGPVALFVVSVSLTVLWAFLPSADSVPSISQHIASTLMFLTQIFVSLMVAVTAVRFVGSLNLANARNPSLPDFSGSSEEE